MRQLKALAVITVIAAVGCGGDDPTEPVGDGTTWDIPFDFTLDEAPDRVSPGDTLNVLGSPLLTETVVFPGSKTPLAIIGNKSASLSSLGSGALIHFSSPKNGTLIRDLNFSGGNPSITVSGSGGLTIEGCTFVGGTVQVLGSGSGLGLDISGSLFRNATGNAVHVQNGAALTAFGNTIARAGGSAIVVENGSSATVNNCILWESAGYGVQCNGGSLSAGSGCNDNFANVMGGYDGCMPPGGDFSLNPQFCDPDNNDYTIAAISPCAPLNSGGCDLIGAYQPNCPS